jgi:hypothetical protein
MSNVTENTKQGSMANVKSLAPILLMEAIEPSLKFWEKLGFAAIVTVPEAAPLAFAIMARGGIEVMLQTRLSVRDDLPNLATQIAASMLYLSVDALDPLIALLGDAPVVVPRRTTFYGADEIYVAEPGGNIIGFAASAPIPAKPETESS